MAIKYFLKHNIKNPVLDSNSKPVPFERLAENFGVIALDDSAPDQVPQITALETAIKRQMGGVVAITEAEYLAKKKDLNPETYPKAPPPFGGLRLADMNPVLAGAGRLQEPAPVAEAPASVPAAEVFSHAPVAEVPAESPAPDSVVPVAPSGKGRRVAMGRVPK